MEIKILCPCGAKFKFDVEPLNGQSPGVVQCPACGRDSTEATNTQIRERLGAPAPVATIASTPAIPRISVSVPGAPAAPTAEAPKAPVAAIRIPASPVSAAPAQPAASVGPKMTVMPVPETTRSLSVKPPGEATVHAAPPSAPAPSNASGDPKAPGSPKMAYMPVPAAGSGSSLSVSGVQPAAAPATGHAPPPPPPVPTHPATSKMVRAERPKSAGSFGMGVTGAVIGCLVGSGLWYFLTLNVNVVEGWRILAWIPGIVGGFCAVLMGKQRSEKLGIAAAVVAAIITIAMQFVVISAINDKRLTEASEAHFKQNIAFAKKAAEAKTDAQIKELIEEDPQNNGYEARSFREAFKKIAKMAEKAQKEEAAKAAGGTAAAPTTPEEAEEITKFRSKRLPELIKFSKGEPSRTRFLEQERARLTDEGDEGDGGILYRKSWLWMGVWIASSVEAAFLLGRGKKKE